MRQSVKPSKITLEPAGESLPFEFQNGLVRLMVPRVVIHEIIVVWNGSLSSSFTPHGRE